MRISGVSGFQGVGVAGRRGMIEKQIKQLEQRRDKLLKQITGEEEIEQPDISSGKAVVGGTKIQAQAPTGSQLINNVQPTETVNYRKAHSSQVSAINDALGIRNFPKIETTQQSVSTESGSSSLSEAVSNFTQSMQQSSGGGGGGGGGGQGVDLEAVMKEIESINTQIMQLQQQLSQEELSSQMAAPAASAENSGSGKSSKPDNPGIPGLPTAEITEDGHVNGYVKLVDLNLPRSSFVDGARGNKFISTHHEKRPDAIPIRSVCVLPTISVHTKPIKSTCKRIH